MGESELSEKPATAVAVVTAQQKLPHKYRKQLMGAGRIWRGRALFFHGALRVQSQSPLGSFRLQRQCSRRRHTGVL